MDRILVGVATPTQEAFQGSLAAGIVIVLAIVAFIGIVTLIIWIVESLPTEDDLDSAYNAVGTILAFLGKFSFLLLQGIWWLIVTSVDAIWSKNLTEKASAAQHSAENLVNQWNSDACEDELGELKRCLFAEGKYSTMRTIEEYFDRINSAVTRFNAHPKEKINHHTPLSKLQSRSAIRFYKRIARSIRGSVRRIDEIKRSDIHATT